MQQRIGPVRERPKGYKFPCYYVHMRCPSPVGVIKPKGHTYCKTVQEAYGLALSIAKHMDGDRQVEIRAKMSGNIRIIAIIRGLNHPGARRGMAKLEEVVHA